jgi:hypothetical protein
VVDDLLALWRDHSERLALRVMALVVLSFVTPSPSDGGASQQCLTVVATLASLLRPAPGQIHHSLCLLMALHWLIEIVNQPTGEVRSLAEMAADCAATPRAPSAPTLKKRKRDEGNEEARKRRWLRRQRSGSCSLPGLPCSPRTGPGITTTTISTAPAQFEFSHTSLRFSSAQPQPCAEC